MMMTPLDESKPSISASSWFRVCSRSSWPPTNPVAPARDLPIASSSSMKMMHGALSFACSNRSRTRAAPTPTNISTNSEPESVKNGTSASPATARARSVLPVPGGPTRSTPFGMRPPSRWYFFGFLRKSTISMSSAFASSTPATSANVVLSSLRSKILCLERPNDRACVGPPPTRRIRNIQIPTMMPSGRTQPKKRSRRNVDSIFPVNSTLCASSSVTRRASSMPGMRVTVKTRTSELEPSSSRNRSPAPPGAVGRVSGFATPRISRLVIATRSILSARSRSWNCHIGSRTPRGAAAHGERAASGSPGGRQGARLPRLPLDRLPARRLGGRAAPPELRGVHPGRSDLRGHHRDHRLAHPSGTVRLALPRVREAHLRRLLHDRPPGRVPPVPVRRLLPEVLGIHDVDLLPDVLDLRAPLLRRDVHDLPLVLRLGVAQRTAEVRPRQPGRPLEPVRHGDPPHREFLGHLHDVARRRHRDGRAQGVGLGGDQQLHVDADQHPPVDRQHRLRWHDRRGVRRVPLPHPDARRGPR